MKMVGLIRDFLSMSYEKLIKAYASGQIMEEISYCCRYVWHPNLRFLDIAEAMYPVRQESLHFMPKILPVEYLEYLLTNINF